LRVAGVRAADLKGYQYSRADVDARSLANQYAQILGQTFTHEMKPLEVEILVAEIGADPASDQLFHILYDGTVLDEKRYSVLGGDADAIAARLAPDLTSVPDLATAVKIANRSLAGPDRTLVADDLEVAVLRRNGSRRAFARLDDAEVSRLLAN
jgi:proteasome alpha subunit